jgi:hypothetical protein
MMEYQRLETLLTLEQGLVEYYASREGLVQGRGISPAAREFFRCHDAAHVVFGCDTTLVEEAMVKTWSVFGTTAGFALVRGYRLAESQEIYERIGWRDTVATALRSLTLLPRVIWRAVRMRKRWPWSEFAPYLPVPLAEIRREFGIALLRR